MLIEQEVMMVIVGHLADEFKVRYTIHYTQFAKIKSVKFIKN